MPRLNQGRSRKFGRGGSNAPKTRDGSKLTATKTKPVKKTLHDHVFYLGTAKAASDYESAKEFIVNHIRKTFVSGNDVAIALEEEKEFSLGASRPTLQVSSESGAAAKKAKDEAFAAEFKADLELYAKHKQTYNDNKVKAYALLWEQCTKGMQSKILNVKDFSTVVKGDPIRLLKEIKRLALNAQDSKYQASVTVNAMHTFLLCRQKDGEALQDYTR
jgi:hypothetical protein